LRGIGADSAHIPRITYLVTGEFGAQVLTPLLGELPGAPQLVTVTNQFFGGNIGVTGLMVGEDVARVLAGQPDGHRYLLPDVCLSRGEFIDGTTVADLPRPVDVIATDGLALRAALS
jgi:NifB/MoaA-like Fe-S oxidoreductase